MKRTQQRSRQPKSRALRRPWWHHSSQLRTEVLEPRIALTISGFVYIDHNDDGIRDSNEDGVPGSQITLTGTDAVGESIAVAALTLNDGSYSFQDVSPGTYTLAQTQPQALVDRAASSEDLDAITEGNQISNIVVSEGVDVSGNNFSESSLKPEYTSIIWFFASSAKSAANIFREVIATGEEDVGNVDLAAAIRAGDSEVPVEQNNVPVANADSFATSQDTTLTQPADDGVLSNDTDIDGDPLTASLVSSTTNGSLSLSMDGSFSYTPNANFTGTDTFTYTASDGLATSNIVTVTISVASNTNSAPVTVADTFSSDEDEILTVTEPEGVLTNDSDADADSLTANIVTSTSNGNVVLSGDGSFTYTPTENFNGTDSFTYMVSDGELVSNTSTVTINVRSVNDAPTPLGDAFSTDEDTVLAVDALLGLLANDTDVEGDGLSALLAAGPQNGTVSIGADGSFAYTPNENFNGMDSFEYLADDGQDQSTATVTVEILAVDDPSTIVLPDEFADPQIPAMRRVGEPISFVVSVDDPDDFDYVFLLDLESSGISAVDAQPAIESMTGQLTWTPTSPGEFELRVIAVNGEGEANQETILVNVLASAVDSGNRT